MTLVRPLEAAAGVFRGQHVSLIFHDSLKRSLTATIHLNACALPLPHTMVVQGDFALHCLLEESPRMRSFVNLLKSDPFYVNGGKDGGQIMMNKSSFGNFLRAALGALI